jgi:tRNA(Ile)-lysidine synthase
MRAGHSHPLLALRRWETVALCKQAGLEPVRDPTNDDLSYLRNRVRHEVLPLLSALAGRDLVPVLARQASLLAEEVDLLEAMADELDPSDAAALSRAPVALSRRAVRRLLREAAAPDGGVTGLPPPLAAVERVLAVARKEALACQVPGGARVRRSGGRLYIERPPIGGAGHIERPAIDGAGPEVPGPGSGPGRRLGPGPRSVDPQ